MLFVGRLTPHKGVDRLLRALPRAHALTVAGTDRSRSRRRRSGTTRRCCGAWPPAATCSSRGPVTDAVAGRAATGGPPCSCSSRRWTMTCYGRPVAISELLGLAVARGDGQRDAGGRQPHRRTARGRRRRRDRVPGRARRRRRRCATGWPTLLADRRRWPAGWATTRDAACSSASPGTPCAAALPRGLPRAGQVTRARGSRRTPPVTPRPARSGLAARRRGPASASAPCSPPGEDLDRDGLGRPAVGSPRGRRRGRDPAAPASGGSSTSRSHTMPRSSSSCAADHHLQPVVVGVQLALGAVDVRASRGRPGPRSPSRPRTSPSHTAAPRAPARLAAVEWRRRPPAARSNANSWVASASSGSSASRSRSRRRRRRDGPPAAQAGPGSSRPACCGSSADGGGTRRPAAAAPASCRTTTPPARCPRAPARRARRPARPGCRTPRRRAERPPSVRRRSSVVAPADRSMASTRCRAPSRSPAATHAAPPRSRRAPARCSSTAREHARPRRGRSRRRARRAPLRRRGSPAAPSRPAETAWPGAASARLRAGTTSRRRDDEAILVRMEREHQLRRPGGSGRLSSTTPDAAVAVAEGIANVPSSAPSVSSSGRAGSSSPRYASSSVPALIPDHEVRTTTSPAPSGGRSTRPPRPGAGRERDGTPLRHDRYPAPAPPVGRTSPCRDCSR